MISYDATNLKNVVTFCVLTRSILTGQVTYHLLDYCLSHDTKSNIYEPTKIMKYIMTGQQIILQHVAIILH